jgi:hypothetical protein
MKLNARILFLAHMVYLEPKHILLLAAFTQHHDMYIQINNTKSWCNPLLIPLAESPCQFPLLTPFSP